MDNQQPEYERLLTFLNTLPTTVNTGVWMVEFKNALQDFLGDVDRILVSVVTTFDLVHPELFEPGSLAISQGSPSRDQGRSGFVDTGIELREVSQEGEIDSLIDEVRKAGIPVDSFHPAEVFQYYMRSVKSLGTIILWNSLENPPVSALTLERMRSLEPFILFALSDCIARGQCANPQSSVFMRALSELVEKTRLTPKEKRVVILQMLGHSYKEIADMVTITVPTLKKHVSAIYRKAGVRSQGELFAKYFAPAFGLTDPGD